MPIEQKGQGGVVLAYVSDHPRMIAVLRAARRYAQRLNLPWIAFHVEDRHEHKYDKEGRVRVLQSLTVAEEMGATVESIQADDAVDGAAVFIAKQQERGTPVKKVFVAEIERDEILEHVRTSFAERLKKSLDCPVEILVLEGGAPFKQSSWLDWTQWRNIRLRELLYALAAVAVATLLIEGINFFFPEVFGSFLRNRRVVYIIAAAFIAGRFGLIPGLITALVGYVTMNFLYVQPSFQGLIRTPADAVDLGLFVSAAFILGLLVNRTRFSNEYRDEQHDRMQAIFRMYRNSLRAHTYQKTLKAVHDELTEALSTEVIFFLPAPFNTERLEAAIPLDVTLDDQDQAALDLCWQEAKITGFATAYYEKSPYRFKPLVTPSAIIGVMAVRMNQKMVADESYRRLLTAITDSVALILERLTLGQAMEDIRMREEREKLRSMLLSSVSHDLKTPLASVIGSLSVFRSIGPQLPEEQRVMLIQTALDEAQRLDSFITNILDMTRLESGQIRFKQEWIKPSDLMRNVEKRLRGRLHFHELVIQKSDDDDSEICIDPMMTEQVLQNILDNAAKYTPRGTRIEVTWRREDGQFQFEIRDRGPGIPESQLEKIFDKYARIKRQDSQIAGTGLGLAIARTVMQAQGGGISAHNHAEGGAVFTITLPKYRTVEAPGDERKIA